MKPRFLPKFPIWVQDWLSSRRILRMTAEQEGGFFRLCLFQWQDGALEGDDQELLTMARVSGLPEVNRLILDAFPVGEDGKRRCAKVAKVRDEVEAFCGTQAEKGRRSGEVRRAKAEPDVNRGSTGVQPGFAPVRTQSNLPSSEFRVLSSDSDSDSNSSTSTPPTPPRGVTRSKRSAGQPAEVVAKRTEYADLLADLRAAEAWQSWLEWCGTSGARAKRPEGQQAAAILNRAKREGAQRFAAAVEYAVAGNYLQPTYQDAQRVNGQAATDFRTPAHRALDEAMKRQGSFLQ